MKCIAVGDPLLPAKYFDKFLAEDALFASYTSFSFLDGVPRSEVRNWIRKMETEYSTYHPVPEELMNAVADAEALFIHLCPVPATLIQAAPKLKYIVTARGGVENIDVAAAKAQGVTIINCPAHNAFAVAEYTIGLMLCELRNIARATAALKAGIWRERYPNSAAIPELRHCTVGIVGFGTIGRLVAERVAVFGSKILVSDPFVPAEQIEALGYSAATMDQLLAQSDIVTLHGRIPADAPPIIGEAQLAQMKPTAYLINTARAVLVDMDAVTRALQENRIMGAALDVFPVEPLPEGYPILACDNATLTNHRGGDTIDSYIAAPELLLQYLHELLETGSTRSMIR